MTTSIGIVFGSMDKIVRDILAYLFVYQNSIQKTFEFRILSCPSGDPFISRLSANPAPTWENVVPEMDKFVSRVKTTNARNAKSYRLHLDSLDAIILLNDTRLSDNYYYI